MMIDSHCHLDFESFNSDREELLRRCVEKGVETIVVPGVEPLQWGRLLQLKQAYAQAVKSDPVESKPGCQIVIAAGLHPWWVDQVNLTAAEFGQLLKLQLQTGDWVAIGECGLDGTIDCPMDRQETFFRIQLQLAEETQLPLILHGHKAHAQVLEMLKRYTLPAGGVIHGFSGSVELAKQYWQQGFFIGVGGTITYKRASKTRKAIAAMPLESLLLETDAPDMPLSGFQGQRNSPLQLVGVAECLAQLKSIQVEKVTEQTTRNSRRLFAL